MSYIDVHGVVRKAVVAKHDAVLTDDSGVERHVFAGQAVPPELVAAYRKGDKSSSDDEESAKARRGGPAQSKAQRAPERDK